jgi:hypothetical protein
MGRSAASGSPVTWSQRHIASSACLGIFSLNDGFISHKGSRSGSGRKALRRRCIGERRVVGSRAIAVSREKADQPRTLAHKGDQAMSVNPSDLMRESRSHNRRTVRYDNPDHRSLYGGRSGNGSFSRRPNASCGSVPRAQNGRRTRRTLCSMGCQRRGTRVFENPPGLNSPARPMREAVPSAK